MFENRALISSVTEDDVCLFHKISGLLHKITPYVLLCGKVRIFANCHSIARTLAETVHELKVVDGYYAGITTDDDSSHVMTHTEHSWLITPDNAIIECFPVGLMSPNPLLIPTKGKYAHAGSGYYLTSQKLAEEICRKIVNRTMFRQVRVIRKIIMQHYLQ